MINSISSAVFEDKPFKLCVSFTISYPDKAIGIYLSLSDDASKDTLISGFPRNLLNDDIDVIPECKAPLLNSCTCPSSFLKPASTEETLLRAPVPQHPQEYAKSTAKKLWVRAAKNGRM